MTPSVSNYMNRHIVHLRSSDRIESALRPLLDFGLTAMPILDDERRPVGMLSLRDIVDTRQAHPNVVTNVCTIGQDASLEDAARMMMDDEIHHLVVVDARGLAVGMLSSADVIRGLVGAEPKHSPSVIRFTTP